MTANRNLKQRVRARALKTGESYTAARDQLTGRYDERMLSRTKSALMYTAGRDPLVFTASGVRFGCALGLAVADVTTSTDSPARRWRRTAREIRS